MSYQEIYLILSYIDYMHDLRGLSDSAVTEAELDILIIARP
jgi:hypothetical protein